MHKAEPYATTLRRRVARWAEIYASAGAAEGTLFLAPLVRHDPQIAQVERFAICREAQVGLPGAFHESTFGLHGPRGKADAGALFVARVEAEAEQGDRRRRRDVVIGQSQLLEWETGCPIDVITDLHVRRIDGNRSEEHTSELQSLRHLVCRLLLEK